eukprot:148373-Heterocapsa_arctica.AAC.1
MLHGNGRFLSVSAAGLPTPVASRPAPQSEGSSQHVRAPVAPMAMYQEEEDREFLLQQLIDTRQ